MKRISELMDRKINWGLSEKEITNSQMKILIMLSECGAESVPLKELERQFELTQATMAGLVARLEKKRLLEGFVDPDDRRVKRVMITQQGRDLCLETRQSMDEYEKWMLKSLSKEEQALFREFLLRISKDITSQPPAL